MLQLPALGINQQFITFTHVTMESEKFICVRETAATNSVVIIDTANPLAPLRRPITADSALMHPIQKIIALKGTSDPVKMFDRTANLSGNQIINYRCDPTERWLVLVGIAPGAPERPALVKGNMQLYSVDQQRSQALEAHAAAFASLTVAGNATPSLLISFAQKTLVNGQVNSKLHIIELGAQPGVPGYQKKQADLFFPPEFADDFPISQKYGLVYIITKLGLLFVYDLESGAAVYRQRISADPIFLTSDAPSIGGFYAVNRKGQVLLATVNEQTLLNNMELALALASRANLPGAEGMVVQQFNNLFAAGQYKEAAELAASSPQAVLRTRETVQKFQSVPVQPGTTPPLLQYFGTLLTKGKLNAFESLELSKLVVSQNKKNLLDNWLNEDKLECSEELGDLVKSLRTDPQGAVNLALMIGQMPDAPKMDYNTVADLFLQRNMIREATSFLLDVLKPNLPEHAHLQTKVLEINLVTYPNVADAILANNMFSYYDRPRIAQLCEKAGLYIKEVERVTRESNFYPPERTKQFLMEAKLPDARPLINVCDRHGFVPDLTLYLYNNNMLRYIEGYVQKVNPTNAPLVVGALLDAECNEEFIKNLILSVRSLLPVEPLVAECEKRNRLKMLSQFLEHLVSEGSTDVLTPENPFRRQLIDQVVSTALPESKNPEQVSITVKAFMTADLPQELIELLEKIVLQNSAFSGNPNLQNLLILTAIKADKSRVMDYINRLDNFDGPAVGEIAVGAELYEEAFVIYKKFGHNVLAVNVLLDYIGSIDRAVDFAQRVEEDAVWTQVGKAQLKAMLVPDAIASFIRANDVTCYPDVIAAAREADCYTDLVRYLLMVRKKIKESKVDTELVYAYAKINQLTDLEEFIAGPHTANLQTAGDRCFDEGLYEAAKILFTAISNWGRLASTLLCGLNIIVQADELDELSDFYQQRGHFDQLIALLEAGLGLERAHMGIFTELGCLYAKYKHEKLMEHLKLFSTRVNIPKLIRVCDEQQHWKELAFLYVAYDEYDNAANVMMAHSPDAWEHVPFKDVLVKVASVEVHYRAVSFYLEEHPNLLNDLLTVLAPRVDHSRVVDILRKAHHLPLIKPYLQSVQNTNLSAVNEALNELLVEEEDYEALRVSIDTYDNFDQIALAVKLEKHELMEFRRIASYVYKKNERYRQSVALSKKDKLYKDAMATAAQSSDKEIAEELLTFFVEQGNKECFAACLYTCYDLIRADVAMELAWMNGLTDFVMPYMIQFLREYTTKVDTLILERNEAKKEKEEASKTETEAKLQQNLYSQLLPALPAPVSAGGGGGGPMAAQFGAPDGYGMQDSYGGGYAQGYGAPQVPQIGYGNYGGYGGGY
eukprot:jgi/Chlat1/6376/Chrsp44S09041